MTFDTKLFAQKLVRCSENLGLEIPALSDATGIPADRITELQTGGAEPTGDEVLILADVFKVDFKFFVSGDAHTPFDQMEVLYRKFGDRVGPEDRQAIAELLYLCTTERFLQEELGRVRRCTFAFLKRGTLFKGHGAEAAESLRAHLAIGDHVAVGDVFAIARNLGIHVFRRRLRNSAISGLTIRLPTVGPCILVNLDEDPYRQRFTLAHEIGHVFLDQEADVVVSFWKENDLVEIRANAFASHFLVPRGLLVRLADRTSHEAAFIALAHQLQVNAQTLARALRDADLIDDRRKRHLSSIRLPRAEKDDPELSASLTEQQRQRKHAMLQRGLSQAYVELCLDAYGDGRISRGRLAEAVLADESELTLVAELYGRRLAHA